jgi:hypothetical protein
MSKPEGRRVHRVITRRRCVVVNLNFVLEGGGGGGSGWRQGHQRAQSGRGHNLAPSPDPDPPEGELDLGKTCQEEPQIQSNRRQRQNGSSTRERWKTGAKILEGAG